MSEPALPTKERLAQALHAAGLFWMEGQARAGKYDDFESEDETPIVNLVRDLEGEGRHDLAERAKDGEWDATKEEAEAWFQSEGKHLIG